MNNATLTLSSLAREAADWFTAGERVSDDTGRHIRVTKDGEPEWLRDLRFAAHDGMMPDDFRHEFIEAALEAIADNEDNLDGARDSMTEPDIYNADLLRWLASHGARSGYCDEAEREFGENGEGGIIGRIARGQYMERAEVFDSVHASLLGELANRENAADEVQS